MDEDCESVHVVSMLTKEILFTILTACGGPTGTPSNPDDLEREAPDEIERDYIFCCHDVDTASKSGDGCVTIGDKQIDSCSTVLACADGFTKKDGTVTCT
jgi:hypothetical protein